MSLEFNKFPFDRYVNDEVKVTLKLHKSMNMEIQFTAKACRKEFKRKFDNDDDLAPDLIHVEGIRVGLDFMDSPNTIDEFRMCCRNKYLLEGCKATAYAAAELAVNQLIAHDGDYYVNGEARRLQEQYTNNFFSERETICNEIVKKLSREMVAAFHLGKLDGFEDGRNMMQTILGKNPSDGCWYRFIQPQDGQPTENIAQSQFVKIPITVQHWSDRNTIFGKRLNNAMQYVKQVEGVMENILKCRVRFFLAGKKQEPTHVDQFNELESRLRNRLSEALDRIYQTGRLCGFESGQTSVKALYFAHFVDERTYTLATRTEEDQWLTLDKSKASVCDCQSCGWCIRSRSTEDMNRKWDKDLKVVANNNNNS